MHATVTSDIWQALGGLAIVLGFLGSIALWALRQIIRSELETFRVAFIVDVIEPIRKDIRSLQGVGE